MRLAVAVGVVLPQVKALQACQAMAVKLLRQVVLVLLIEAVAAVGRQFKPAQPKLGVRAAVAWLLFLFPQRLIAALLLDRLLLQQAD
jgi:chromate transport protein ChrA